jgi:hypothetical protein
MAMKTAAQMVGSRDTFWPLWSRQYNNVLTRCVEVKLPSFRPPPPPPKDEPAAAAAATGIILAAHIKRVRIDRRGVHNETMKFSDEGHA